MGAVGFVIIGLIVLVVLWLVTGYNRMVGLKNRIENAWAQIDVQLKRRYDLIPNLVETVRGYATHEKEVFENVARARSAMNDAHGVEAQAQAQNQITQALKSLFAVSEAYPELKANTNFLELQEEISGTESQIAHQRSFYNDLVGTYNTLIESFPTNILASNFGFSKREYFPMDDESRENVDVKF